VDSGIEQQSLWDDGGDRVFGQALHGGNLAGILSVAGRRVLKAIPDELAEDPAVALLRDVLPNPPESYDPRPYIEANTWVFARTMPENPHEYVMLRASTDWREHLRFLRWLRVYGEVERWLDGRRYRYRIVDGWRYWAMWSPNDTILNREVAS
jgi:hypothetical protein